MWGWIAKVVSNPVVRKVIIPAVGRALEKVFDKAIGRIKTKSAVKAAKAAKTVEELREASKKLSESSARR